MTDPYKRGAVIYVDVDDTLVRHASSAPAPIANVIDQVRRLHARGFSLYCWSTGGAEYAQRIATELGVAACFTAFLPKPTILIDDQEISVWLLKSFHPSSVDDAALDAFLP
jgi:predicted HAD superfamily phosphohydrolase YqeG